MAKLFYVVGDIFLAQPLRIMEKNAGFGTDVNQVMKDNIIWKVHECMLEVNLNFTVFRKHGARVAVSENLQRISVDSA